MSTELVAPARTPWINEAKAAIRKLGWHTEGKHLGYYPNEVLVEPHDPTICGWELLSRGIAEAMSGRRTWRGGVVIGHDGGGKYAVLVEDYRILAVRGDRMRIAKGGR